MVEFPLNITRNWGWKLYLSGCMGFSAATRFRSTIQLSSPAKGAGLDSEKSAPPLITDVEAVGKPKNKLKLLLG